MNITKLLTTLGVWIFAAIMGAAMWAALWILFFEDTSHV